MGSKIFLLLCALFLSAPLHGQQTVETRPSASLQEAIDLLSNTEAAMKKQTALIDGLQAELSASKADLETLESLRTEALRTFERQSALLAASNQSLRKWRTSFFWAIPLAAAAGLISGVLIAK